MATAKKSPAKRPATTAPTMAQIIAKHRAAGTIGNAGNGTVPVTFRGKQYASVKSFVTDNAGTPAGRNLLASITAADLDKCGNSQAAAVFSRALAAAVA